MKFKVKRFASIDFTYLSDDVSLFTVACRQKIKIRFLSECRSAPAPRHERVLGMQWWKHILNGEIVDFVN